MNFNKSKPLAKAPVIRKSTVRIAIPPATVVRTASHASTASSTGSTRPSPVPRSADRFQLSQRPAGARSSSPASSTAARRRTAAASNGANARGVKRKSATPQLAMFSSDEDEEDEESGRSRRGGGGEGGGSSDIGASDSDVSRKRIKSSVSSIESHDDGRPRRKLIAEEAFVEQTAATTMQQRFIHGAAITSGKDQAKFKNPWSDPDFDTVRLHYPSRGQREKFELKMPRSEYNEYQPLEDIKETIFTICRFYFSPDDAARYDSEEKETGFQRKFNRAFVHRDIDEFKDIVREFNRLLDERVQNGAVRRELQRRAAQGGGRPHLDWVKRILDQVYARTVSPQVETLRAYENGTDNVYGELLPGFVSTILRQTGLAHDHVFIDLGSGVANVVLQAALEVGCEAWGVEMMPNPCELARRQAREFRERTRLWGLAAGAVHLVEGDFTAYPANAPVLAVLRRADVVLVNNQAFTPGLNDKLRDMFLDLKDGCRVVSLKPFVPEGHKITNRNVGSVVNLFVQRKEMYFSNAVSWTDQMGSYYIATKDARPLEAFLRRNGGAGR